MRAIREELEESEIVKVWRGREGERRMMMRKDVNVNRLTERIEERERESPRRRKSYR